MKNIIVTPNYPGLIDEGRRFRIDGSLQADGQIKIDLGRKPIFVSGSIEAGESIKAGGSIKAGWSIKAGEGIDAGWSIKAGGSVEAGWSIESSRSIEAGRSIKAGENIYAQMSITCRFSLSVGLRVFSGLCFWRNPEPDEMRVTCGRLTGGEIAFGNLVETGEIE